MDQTTLNNHYKNLAENYDEAFAERKPEKRKVNNSFDFGGEEGARVIARLLKMKEEDHMVDLGAGTCKTAGMLAKIVSLKHPVLCVDPVQEMLEIGKKKKIASIETLCATAEEFVKKDLKYDKILIKGTVHHFPVNKMREIFTGIHRQLNPSGMILINKTGVNKGVGAPFFKKGIDTRNSIQAGLTDLLETLLKDLGFSVNIQRFEEHMDITRVEATESIRKKSLSCLSALSSEELAQGISEVERDYDDVIAYKTVWEMIIAQKDMDS